MILIQEIIRDVVNRVSDKLCMDINYQCGDAGYVLDQLEIMSGSNGAESFKYPLFVLYMPITEDKTDNRYYCKAYLKMLIATLSESGYSYEQRLEYSFRQTLHPIYEVFIDELKKERRMDFGYPNFIEHSYTDNYQYGYYGTKIGNKPVNFDTIDGIDIDNLKIKIKNEHLCKNLPFGK